MSTSLLELQAPDAKTWALPPPEKRLMQLLDRAIILLMVVILLTLSWPISMVLLQRAHSKTAMSSPASSGLHTGPVSPHASRQSALPISP